MINKKDYKEVDGIFYKKETPDDLIKVLNDCYKNDIRIIIDYGDVKTGKSWGEDCDIIGYIGRSTGEIKIPLLVYNKRCYGGGGLLDNCIIGVKTSRGKKQLYKLITS
ncbi:hypothetical protein HGB13_00110 [bacterium]|nr:hypothetical protein [bacterium]